MLKKYTLTFLITIFCSISFAQQDTLLEDLDDPDYLVRRSALIKIFNDSLYQYSNVLEDKIFQQQEVGMLTRYLRTINILRTPNAHQIILQFIQGADTLCNRKYSRDPLEERVIATGYLLNYQDYSTINYVQEMVNNTRPNYNLYAFMLLDDIAKEAPPWEQWAKNELVYAAQNATDNLFRIYAIDYLLRIYGEEMIPLTVDAARNDPEWGNRDIFIEDLVNNNYNDIHNFLKERLYADPYGTVRWSIADFLINSVYGQPSDYKFVLDYLITEPDSNTSYVISNDIYYDDIPTPDSTLNSLVLTDTLISYNNQLYNYQWITSDSLYNNYSARLQTIRDLIANSNYTSAQTEIDTMQASVEENYNSPTALLTTEGWKFLHYYLEYIEQRINN
jgi:hypothetical protein